MAKTNTRFFCKDCGHEELRWLGRCPGCGAWNTMGEMTVAKPGARQGRPRLQRRRRRDRLRRRPPRAAACGASRCRCRGSRRRRCGACPSSRPRWPGSLGGGLVEGSVVLLGGEPGVGKSTLLTGLALWWVRQGIRVLYVAGEESPAQIRMRAERLGFKPDDEEGFHILPEVHLEHLIETLQEQRAAAGPDAPPAVIIADSHPDPAQREHRRLSRQPHPDPLLRRRAGRLRPAQRLPRVPGGPRDQDRRPGRSQAARAHGRHGAVLRGQRRRRHPHGARGEEPLRHHRRAGGAGDARRRPGAGRPGRRALPQRAGGASSPGRRSARSRTARAPSWWRCRPWSRRSRYGTPQRVVQGVDSKRVALLAAILEKRAGMDLAGCDIFVKVAGGGRIDDPGADLAILAALASSLREKPDPRGHPGAGRGGPDRRGAAGGGPRGAACARPPATGSSGRSWPHPRPRVPAGPQGAAPGDRHQRGGGGRPVPVAHGAAGATRQGGASWPLRNPDCT